MSDIINIPKFKHASDVLDLALATDVPWDAESIRYLGAKVAKWIDRLERDNALLNAGLKFNPTNEHRRPSPRPSKERRNLLPHVEGVGSIIPKGPIAYFVEGIGTRLVKIGWSNSLGSRLLDLAIYSPTPLRLLCWQRIKGRQCEQALHARFDQYRVYGEWFRLEGDLFEYVESQKSVRRRRREQTHQEAA